MLFFTCRRQSRERPIPPARPGQRGVVAGAPAIRLRLLITAAVVSALVRADVAARDYGQYRDTDPAIKEWVQRLTDKNGQGCCATADGHPAEYEWDMAGDHYRVRIEGEWYDVPPEAVIDQPNRLGHATVWYWWDWTLDGKKTHHIRCFLPGPGG